MTGDLFGGTVRRNLIAFYTGGQYLKTLEFGWTLEIDDFVSIGAIKREFASVRTYVDSISGVSDAEWKIILEEVGENRLRQAVVVNAVVDSERIEAIITLLSSTMRWIKDEAASICAAIKRPVVVGQNVYTGEDGLQITGQSKDRLKILEAFLRAHSLAGKIVCEVNGSKIGYAHKFENDGSLIKAGPASQHTFSVTGIERKGGRTIMHTSISSGSKSCMEVIVPQDFWNSKRFVELLEKSVVSPVSGVRASLRPLWNWTVPPDSYPQGFELDDLL